MVSHTLTRKLVLTLISSASFACGSEALGAEVLQLTTDVAKMVKVNRADEGNFIAFVAKPETADVYFGPKNILMIVGKKEGTTNLIVLDKNTGAVMYNAMLQVGAGTQTSVRVYVGTDKSTGYLCTKSTCESSAIVTTEAQVSTSESRGQTKVSQ